MNGDRESMVARVRPLPYVSTDVQTRTTGAVAAMEAVGKNMPRLSEEQGLPLRRVTSLFKKQPSTKAPLRRGDAHPRSVGWRCKGPGSRIFRSYLLLEEEATPRLNARSEVKQLSLCLKI